MSILIKGMEMPKECDVDCPVLSTPVCPIKSWNALMVVEDGKRHPDCPLIPVPPHGRLIDADDLLAMVKRAMEDDDMYKDDYRDVRDWLAVAPTIIPAEEDET